MALSCNHALAAEKLQGKSHYTFASPVPSQLLREMTTDRPDITESPFTVDAGHIQFETNLFAYAKSRPDMAGIVTESYEFLTANMRIGVANHAELAFVVQPYGVTRMFPPAARASGIGNFEIRVKLNLWGNDSYDKPGDTALALLPYLSFPVDRNNGIGANAVEGGLIVPFNVKLTEVLDLGLNAGIETVHNDPGSGHHAEFLASASLAYAWSDHFGTYYEIAGRFDTGDPRGDIVFLATGLTCALNDNVQLDAGINFGMNGATDRINPFAGVSIRF